MCADMTSSSSAGVLTRLLLFVVVCGVAAGPLWAAGNRRAKIHLWHCVPTCKQHQARVAACQRCQSALQLSVVHGAWDGSQLECSRFLHVTLAATWLTAAQPIVRRESSDIHSWRVLPAGGSNCAASSWCVGMTPKWRCLCDSCDCRHTWAPFQRITVHSSRKTLLVPQQWCS